MSNISNFDFVLPNLNNVELSIQDCGELSHHFQTIAEYFWHKKQAQQARAEGRRMDALQEDKRCDRLLKQIPERMRRIQI